VLLRYATAQPLCILHNAGADTYVFFANEKVPAEFVISQSAIKRIIPVSSFRITQSGADYHIRFQNAGTHCLIRCYLNNGDSLQLLLLTNREALTSWKVKLQSKDCLFISPDNVIADQEHIRMQSTGNATFEWYTYPAITHLKTGQQQSFIQTKGDVFTHYTWHLPEKKMQVAWKEDSTIATGLLPAVPQKVKADTTNVSMPLYGKELQSVPEAKYYLATIPAAVLDGLSNVFLQINYLGDTQAAYAESRLIADDFYDGLPMMISLTSVSRALQNRQLSFLVTPLTDEKKIFFEKGIREPMQGRHIAELKSMKLIPQYEIVLAEK
jgi:beta-galactosidase